MDAAPKLTTMESASEASEDEEAPSPIKLPPPAVAAPAKKRPLEQSLIYSTDPGEKVAWSDDEAETTKKADAPKAKAPRPAPPPRRLVVANRHAIKSTCEWFTFNGQQAHLFPLCWRIGGGAGRLDGVTEHRIADDDGINYAIGENNLSARTDPEKGSDLGAAEMLGLAAVAAEISEVLTEDPKCGVVVADIWATDYAPLVVGLATRLFTVASRNAPAVSVGVRKPKNPKLKGLLKEMGRVVSEQQMKAKLSEFYRASW
jgi:hypothetical protein